MVAIKTKIPMFSLEENQKFITRRIFQKSQINRDENHSTTFFLQMNQFSPHGILKLKLFVCFFVEKYASQ